MLGFNLQEGRRHQGGKPVCVFQTTTASTVVSEELIGSTSVDALKFFSLEKLLSVTCHLCW